MTYNDHIDRLRGHRSDSTPLAFWYPCANGETKMNDDKLIWPETDVTDITLAKMAGDDKPAPQFGEPWNSTPPNAANWYWARHHNFGEEIVWVGPLDGRIGAPLYAYGTKNIDGFLDDLLDGSVEWCNQAVMEPSAMVQIYELISRSALVVSRHTDCHKHPVEYAPCKTCAETDMLISDLSALLARLDAGRGDRE